MKAVSSLPEQQEDRLAERILLALRDLRFGSVEIMVHDGRVVQVERREKMRFDTADQPRRR